MRKRIEAGVGAVAALAVIGAVWLRPHGGSPDASAAAAAPVSMQAADVQTQLNATQRSIDAVDRLLDAMPAELTNLDALARSLPTPDAAFAFVRDQIAYEPYAGVQKGAWGTLATRGGNDLDKALLLAALLKAQNLDVHLAHGTLDEAARRRLASEASSRPDAVAQTLRAMKRPAAAVALSPADQAFAAQFAASVTRRKAALRTTVDQAYGRLAVLAPQTASSGLVPSADHYWVQAQVDDKETDFDPSLTTDVSGSRLAEAVDAIDPDAVPDQQFQTVQLSVVAAYLDGSRLTQKTVLDATVHAADLLGKPLRLVISPQSTGAAVNDFQAQLVVNTDTTPGDVFQLHGGGEPAGSEGDPGGLGGFGGLTGGTPTSSPAAIAASHTGPELARLWLEVVESAPGEQPFKVHRVILDRLNDSGHALAQGQTDALARVLLVQVWDGGLDAGAFSPPFVYRTQNAELAVAQKGGGATASAQGQNTQVAPDDLPAPTLSGTLVHLFFSSDLARHVIGANLGPDVRSYYRVPRLAFVRRGFRVADWGSTSPSAAYAEGIDLLDPSMAFTGPAAGARELALRAGITDTALEAHAGTVRARVGTLAVFAALPPEAAGRRYARGSGLPGTLPASIRRALDEDVSTDNIIVAPSALVTVNGIHGYGWWSFTAGTPYALGKMDLGGGQALTEIGQVQKEVVDKIMPFVQFYGACLRCYMDGISTALNGGGPKSPEGLQKIMPGDQKKFLECMVGAICDLIADLVADEVGEFAGDEQEREQLGEEIEEYNQLQQKFASTLAGLWGKGAQEGGIKNCEAAMKGALG